MSLYIFNEQVRSTATELVDQDVQKFNAASAGTLILGNGFVIGDYVEQAMWQLTNNIAQRRNAYGGTTAVNAQTLGQILDRSVKIDGRVGPINITSTMFRRIGAGESEPAAVVAAQASAAMFQDYLNTTAACLVAAIGGNSALVNDITSKTGRAGTVTMQALNISNSKMGDRSNQIRAYIMHSTPFHALVDQAINNVEQLFQIGDLTVYSDFLGRRFVVSDIPALENMNSGGTAVESYNTLCLVPGAAVVQVGGLYDMVTTEHTGGENIMRQMQGEYDFHASLKGYAWGGQKTGQSPTDAELATAANWTKVATSNKDTAGVLLKSKADFQDLTTP